MKRRGIFIFVLLIILIVLAKTDFIVYADDISYALEDVLIKLGDQSIVKVPLDEYGMAYLSKTKSDLFNFLKGENRHIDVVGISSKDKHVLMEEYGINFLILKREGKLGIHKLISKAIEDSTHLDSLYMGSSDINEYKVDIISLQMKDLDFRVDSNLAEANIPYEMLKQPIKTLNVAFDKPVKIIKLNGEELPLRFIDKIERSGYSLDEYYEEFKFNLGDSYKYSMIFDASSNAYKSTTIITVINELGYERNIKVVITR